MTNWKAIPGYEGLYEVSDDGQVRSVERYVRMGRGEGYLRLIKSSMRSLQTDPNGYEAIKGPRQVNNKDKTHCKRGHEFTPENTYKVKSGRQCRTCTIEAARRQRNAKDR